MADLFGNLISVPEPTINGVFPLRIDYDVERTDGAQYVIHKIGLKKEQRILKRKNGNRWRLSNFNAEQSELETLYAFFDTHRNPQDLFYFYDPREAPCPDENGESEIGRYIVRFNTAELTADQIRDGMVSVGVELIEVNTSTTNIFVGVAWTYYNWRRPGETLPNFVQSELVTDNALVHFVKIHPFGVADPIRVSDRRVFLAQTFGPAPTARYGIYLPRLLSWDIHQEIDSSDQATFTFDDADHVWSDYCKQVDLDGADIDFTVYTDGPSSGVGLLQLWRGYIADWQWNHKDGTISIQCEGGLQALNQQFPARDISTTCPLQFNDGGECPYSTKGSGGDPGTCDKSLDGANGCTAHGMTNYFQGVVIKPQAVSGKLTNTGFLGLFKKSYTSTSTPLKTVYGKPLAVCYGSGKQIVEADIFETRDESEFFVASGLLSEGPIVNIGQVLLDGMTQHYGYQPVKAYGTLGQNVGTIIDSTFRSSRTSFVSVRRTDEIGIQNPNETHRILVEVLSGVRCLIFYWWTGPFTSHAEVESTNPVHIAVDVALRTAGLRFPPYYLGPDWVKENFLDLNTYLDAAIFCAALVSKLVGSGTEHRFEFRGTIREGKPGIDHVRDVLAHAPIDLIWSFGQICPKARKDDILVPPPYQITFQEAENIIDGSFNAARLKPRFNRLKYIYSDVDYDFAERDIEIYDEKQAIRTGWFDFNAALNPLYRRPRYKTEQRTLTGGFNRSQVLRLAMQVLSEELGGGIGNEADQIAARQVNLTAPLLGLAVEIGDVSKVIHAELPNGSAYVRWKSWRYSDDLSVQLSGVTIASSMYTSPIPQVPSSTEGDPVSGIPGGSQGTDGSENAPQALTPPVLTLLSANYRTAVVKVSDPPLLTNYLITQDADNSGFSAGLSSSTYNLPKASFEVNGTAGTTRYVRAKWRRSTDPLEESGWSNVLAILFPKIQADEIESVPEEEGMQAPPVPVIQNVLGWTEFIELCLLINQKGEGCKVGYGINLAGNGQTWIYVQNTSLSSDVAIVEARLYINAPMSIDCNADTIVTAGWHPGDGFTVSTPPPDVSNYGPYISNPPVADIGASRGQIQYYKVLKDPPPDVDPSSPDYECLRYRCPESSDPGYNADYKCMTVFDQAKTKSSFHLPGGNNYYVRVNCGVCRAFAVYLAPVGHTIFLPFLPVSQGTGHFAGFTNNGWVYVRFSSGFELLQPARDLGADLGGIVLLPAETEILQIDDFFVFMSGTSFSNTLGAQSGRWEDQLGDLPDGVFLVMISRSTHFLVSNFAGVPLDPADETGATKYYFRIGARRQKNFAQTDFLYSSTLSEEVTGKLGTAAEFLAEFTDTPLSRRSVWKDPVATFADLPAAGEAGEAHLVLDTGLLYAWINGEWRLPTIPTQRVVGEIIFTIQVVAVGSNRSYQPTVPKNILNGTLTGWCLKADTAGNGTTTFDINLNGTTIFTNQSNRPTLLNGQTKSTGTTIDVTSMTSEGDWTIDVDGVPSTPPSRVTAILYFRQDVQEV